MIRLISLTIPYLWYLGGQKHSWLRDLLVPFIISIAYALQGHYWLALAVSVTYNIIRLGYGNYSPQDDDKPSLLARLTHDRKGYWIRLLYGVICASIGALPLVIYTHAYALYIYYILLNAVIGFSVSYFKLDVLPTDLLVGAGIGSVVWLIVLR